MTRSFGSTQVTSESFIEAQRLITEGLEQGDPSTATAGVLRFTELASTGCARSSRTPVVGSEPSRRSPRGASTTAAIDRVPGRAVAWRHDIED
jgi:hypothetical protein